MTSQSALGNTRQTTSRGILLFVARNLTSRLSRTGLIAATLSLAATLLITSVAGTAILKAPVANMLEQQLAADIVIDVDSRALSLQTINHWWSEHPGVAIVGQPRPTYKTLTRPLHNDRELGSQFLLTEQAPDSDVIDKLQMISGSSAARLEDDSIWLTVTLASAEGIAVGDTVDIPIGDRIVAMKVSALIVDPHYSSGFISPVRAWVAPGALAQRLPPSRLHDVQIPIRLHEGIDVAKSWDEFKASQGGVFPGSSLLRADVESSYAQTLGIMTALILLFGLLALVVSLLIISATVASDVTANYRNFGILKSLGFTPANILLSYLLQYGALAAVAVLVGFALAYAASSSLAQLMLESIGASVGLGLFAVSAAPAALVLLAMIPLVAVLSAQRASRLNAAIAIRFGAPPSTSGSTAGLGIGALNTLGTPVFLGLRDLLVGRTRDLFGLITLAVTSAVILFAVNVYQSTVSLGSNLPFWGLDGSDVRLIRDTSPAFSIRYERLRDELARRTNVAAVTGLLNSGASVAVNGDGRTIDVEGHIVDGQFEAFGYQNLIGRSPAGDNEISLGFPLADKLGVAPGDEVRLYLQGQPLTLKVTGIFQGTSNGGLFYRTTLTAAQRAVPFFAPDSLLIKLVDNNQRAEFMTALQAELGQAAQVERSEKLVESQLAQVASGLGTLLVAISVVLLMVASIGIFNSTAMGIEESRRQLGILKSLGMTNAALRWSSVSKALLLAIAGSVAGGLLYAAGGESLINSMMGGVGMRVFPLAFDPVASLLMPVAVLCIAVVSAWLPTHRTTQLLARELILDE